MSVAAARRMVQRPRVWIWLALMLGLGIALGYVPLFGVLGYELAVAVALVAAVAGVDLGVAFAREVQRLPEAARHPGRALAGSTVLASAFAVAAIVPPAIVCAVRGLWVPTCDWWFGIAAYAKLPVATAVLAGAFGHAVGIAVGSRKRRGWLPHRGTVLAIVLLLVLALAAAWRFYSEPPVFVYSPIIGYYPGEIYDETVTLGAPLGWERLESLVWVIAIVALLVTRLDAPTFRLRLRAPRPAGARWRALAIAAIAAASGVVLHRSAGTLGYAIDAGDIQEALGGRLETAHFIIYYAKTPAIEAELPLIAEDHELRYAEVVAQLGAAPEGKLGSYYFASSDQKARWMGARHVEMSKPWRHEIYVDDQGFPQRSLRHEIAHAVASAFGDPWFGVAARRLLGAPVLFSPGLVEGLAVAIDWPGGDALTPHQSVRALQQLGFEPRLDELMSMQFFAVSSARSYTTAGSFVRFLLDSYGADKLRDLYGNGGDFVASYGKPRGELEREWRTMIEAIELPPEVIEAARERFRGGSVFARPCPHAVAARIDEATNAAGAGEHARAVSLIRDVCRDAPEEPNYRMGLASILSTGGPAERAEAVAIWNALADATTGITASIRVDALEHLTRDVATRGDLVAAGALLDRAAALPSDGAQRRQLDAERLAIHHQGPAGPALRAYFFVIPSGAKTWAVMASLAEPDLGFAHYLLGLQHYNHGDFDDADAELQVALARGLPNLGFQRNAARLLAIASYRSHDAEGTGRAIAVLQGSDMTESDHLLGLDWSRRLAFDATGHL